MHLSFISADFQLHNEASNSQKLASSLQTTCWHGYGMHTYNMEVKMAQFFF